MLEENLLRELRGSDGSRVVVRDGRFSVDEVSARQVLATMRLEDPRAYVLELVMVASMLDASVVIMHVDTSLMVLRCDGAAVEGEALEELYSAVFRQGSGLRQRDEALRHLALAIGSAHRLGVSQMIVESIDREVMHRLEMRGAASRDEILSRPRKARDSSKEGVRVEVRQKLAPHHVSIFWERVKGRQREVMLLRERCRFASFALWVNQERISRGPHLVGPHDVTFSFRGEVHQARGTIGLRICRPGASGNDGVIFWVKHGVIFEQERLASDGGFVVEAVIESPELQLDLSLGSVVRDAIWEGIRSQVLLGQMHRGVRRLLEPWSMGGDGDIDVTRLPDLATSKVYPWVNHLNVNRIKQIAFFMFTQIGDLLASHATLSPHTRELVRFLERFAIWPVADAVEGDASWVRSVRSMRALGIGFESGRTLYMSRTQHDVRIEALDDQHILWVRSYDRDRPLERLRAYLPSLRVEDITVRLEQEALRARNLHEWQKRPRYPRLRDEIHAVNRIVSHEDGEVELAISTAGKRRAQLVLAPSHRWIRQIPLDDVEPTQLVLIWRGAMRLSWLCHDVERDLLSWRYLLLSLESWPELIRRYAASRQTTGTELSKMEREALLVSLKSWVMGTLPVSLCKALGFWQSAWMGEYERWWRSAEGASPFRLFAWYRARVTRARFDRWLMVQMLGAVAQSALFEDVRGHHVSLHAIVEELKHNETLWVVREEAAHLARRHCRRLDEARHVIVLDRHAAEVLPVICGPSGIQQAEALLAALVHERGFLELSQEEPRVARALVRVRLDDESRGLRGEIGLSERGWYQARTGVCEVRLLYRGRYVGATRFRLPLGHGEAVVACDRFRMRADWKEVEHDEAYFEVVHRVERSVEALYLEVLEKMQREHGTVNQLVAWFEWMCCMVESSREHGVFGEAFVGRVQSASVWKVWRVEQGAFEVMGCEGVRAIFERRGGDLVYATERVVRGGGVQGADLKDVLVVPLEAERPGVSLMRAFAGLHRVLSLEEFVQGGRDLEAAREHFLERPTHEAVLVRGGELRRGSGVWRAGAGEVAMFAAVSDALFCRGRLEMTFLSEGREVMRREVMWRMMPGRFVAVIEIEGLIDWSVSDAVDGSVQQVAERRVMEACEALFDAWCAGVEEGHGEGVTSEAERMVALWCWQLREGRMGEQRALYERLCGLPLWRDGEGTYLAIDALRTRDVVRLVSVSQEHDTQSVQTLCEEDFETFRRELEGASFPARVVGVLDARRKARPLQLASTAGDDVGSESMVARDVIEDRSLEERLRLGLDEVCGDEVYLRCSDRLWRFHVASVHTDGGAAVAGQDGVWCDRDARLVELLRGVWCSDRIALGMMMSVVYSVINVSEEETLDAHEEIFLQRLARWSAHEA